MKLLLGFMWLLHWLPLPLLGRFGNLIGSLLFILLPSRRHITLTNLRLCMPELTEAERVVLARQHFQAYSRSVWERGVLWWASEARLRRLIQLDPGSTEPAQGGGHLEKVVVQRRTQEIDLHPPHNDDQPAFFAQPLLVKAQGTHPLRPGPLGEFQVAGVIDDAPGVGVFVIDAGGDFMGGHIRTLPGNRSG